LVTATDTSDDIIKRAAEDQDRPQRSFPVFLRTLNSNFNLMNHSRAYRAQSTKKFYTMGESDKAGSSYRRRRAHAAFANATGCAKHRPIGGFLPGATRDRPSRLPTG